MISPLFTPEDVKSLRDVAETLRSCWGVKMPGLVTVESLGGPVTFSAHHFADCESVADRIQQWLDQQASGAVVSFGPGHYTITAATRSGEHAFTVPLSVIDPTVIHETDLQEG